MAMPSLTQEIKKAIEAERVKNLAYIRYVQALCHPHSEAWEALEAARKLIVGGDKISV